MPAFPKSGFLPGILLKGRCKFRKRETHDLVGNNLADSDYGRFYGLGNNSAGCRRLVC
jgi:hypothetical protein